MLSTLALTPIVVERRALFLSKVNAPPSPTATGLPKTPPESPSIFHYSLPSPGLVSPLALFESLQQDETTGSPQFPSVQPWVEQVEYRRLMVANSRIPSLEQITAHLSTQGHPAASKEERPPIPLPTFLRPSSRMRSTPELLGVLSNDMAEAEITFLEQIHVPVSKTADFPYSELEPYLEFIYLFPLLETICLFTLYNVIAIVFLYLTEGGTYSRWSKLSTTIDLR